MAKKPTSMKSKPGMHKPGMYPMPDGHMMKDSEMQKMMSKKPNKNKKGGY